MGVLLIVVLLLFLDLDIVVWKVPSFRIGCYIILVVSFVGVCSKQFVSMCWVVLPGCPHWKLVYPGHGAFDDKMISLPQLPLSAQLLDARVTY